MAEIKISDLTPKGVNLAVTDLLVISEDIGGGLYETKSITGDEILNAVAKTAVAVRNQTGATIYKGTIVYISGASGGKALISKAQANSEITSSKTLGVVTADIANNANGNVLTNGLITDLDTRTTATHPFTADTLVIGDDLYLSPTNAGYVTNVKPIAPNNLVSIGKVLETSSTTGQILYAIVNGYELGELHDVDTTGAVSGDLLALNGGIWKPTSIFPKIPNIIVSYTTVNRDKLIWTAGDIIFNSTTLLLEQYNGTTWFSTYIENSDFINWIEGGINGGGSIAGNAYWATNAGAGLKKATTLTNNSTSQTGVWYKSVPQITQYKRIVLEADHVSGGGTGGDGIWYSLFANSTSYSANELTANNSYTIYFDEWNDLVKLYYNGILLQQNEFNFIDLGAQYIKKIKFIIDYNPTTNTSVIYCNITGSNSGTGVCIQFTDTVQRNLTGQYVLIGGKTGSLTNFHELHYLSIRKFYNY